jgi:hypothetical protein
MSERNCLPVWSFKFHEQLALLTREALNLFYFHLYAFCQFHAYNMCTQTKDLNLPKPLWHRSLQQGGHSFLAAPSFLSRKDTPDEITANDQALAAQTSLL